MLNGLFAQKKDKLNPIAVYEKVWQEHNSDTRLKLIKTIWLDDSTFEDPSASIKGAVALNNVINEFYKKYPDAGLTSGKKSCKRQLCKLGLEDFRLKRKTCNGRP